MIFRETWSAVTAQLHKVKLSWALIVAGAIMVIVCTYYVVPTRERIEEVNIGINTNDISDVFIRANVELYPEGSGKVWIIITGLERSIKMNPDQQESAKTPCVDISTDHREVYVTQGRNSRKSEASSSHRFKTSKGTCSDVPGGGPSPSLQHFSTGKIDIHRFGIEIYIAEFLSPTTMGYSGILNLSIRADHHKTRMFSLTLKAPHYLSLSESFPKPLAIKLDTPRLAKTTKTFWWGTLHI